MSKQNSMKNLKSLTLLIIILVASFLRLYRLGSYPALNADEAAIGYNAYSLIQTGKDEHSNAWPIHFQSFNDYKPGLYIYFVMPFVKLFGLNEWSVRLPNVILGVLSVLLLHYLIKELKIGKPLQSKERSGSVGKIELWKLEFIAPALLAINPWHLHYSRGAWEVNTATFFILLGIYLFFKGLEKLVPLQLSALSFALSLYTYHSARIVSPLIVLGLVFIYRKELKVKLGNLLIAGLIGIVAVTPLVKDFSRSDVISRATGVGLFADPGPIERTNEQRSEHKDYLSSSVRVFHNKLINYGLTFVNNWGQHYWGEFLFLTGDTIQRNRVPETGQLHLFEFLTLFLGIIFIIKTYSLSAKAYTLILWWLLIAPTAAALTFQSPHALRAHNMVIPLTIISAIGSSFLITKLSYIKHNLNVYKSFSIWHLVFAILFILNVTRYFHMYYKHMGKEYPFSSQYGVKELSDYVVKNGDRYKNVIITNNYDQPYILFLFYLKYPPQDFQKEHVLTPRDKYGFSTVNSFDKYIFKGIDWDVDKVKYPNSLIVGTDKEIPNEANIVDRIYGSNGNLYFKTVAN